MKRNLLMMKNHRWLKWAAAIGCLCSSGAVSPAIALNLTFDQVACLGELDRGASGPNKEEQYINQLAGMNLNSAVRVRGTTYTRSGNLFNSLPAADFASRVNHEHTGIILDGTFDYLLARYSSGATVVWHVVGLTGNYDIPGSYDGDRAIHHYSLFQSVDLAHLDDQLTPPNGAKVPDPGSTLALLGVSLTSLGLIHRKLRKSRNDPRSF